MALTLEDVEALLAGQRGPIWAGELHVGAAELLGLATPNVYLSRESAVHILEDHGDHIDQFELLRLPFVVRQGMLIREREKPRIVIACYQIPGSYRRVGAVLKSANRYSEMWVQTYHRTHRRQTQALIQRGDVIKYHD